jgi:hypothetical protein
VDRVPDHPLGGDGRIISGVTGPEARRGQAQGEDAGGGERTDEESETLDHDLWVLLSGVADGRSVPSAPWRAVWPA